MITTLMIPVEKIDVGERRRSDFGDIARLAEGIQKVGLLSPILVDQNGTDRYRLIFGERRLRAVQLLGRTAIRAQLVAQLSEERLREIELEENENRKALTERERARTFASSKRLVEQAQQAAEVLTQNASKPDPRPKGGRPRDPASQRSVAAALAVPQQEISRAHQHVEFAERYPFMQGQGWRQSHVLGIQEQCSTLPQGEADSAMSVLNCAKLLHPIDATTLLNNISEKPQAERAALYALAASDDPRDRERALTDAANKPPMPDPRLGSLDTAMQALLRATKPFPDDPLTPRIEAARAELGAIRAAIKQPKPAPGAIQ